MFDKLEKLEEFINSFLSKIAKSIAELLLKIFYAIVPKKVIELYTKSKNQVTLKATSIKGEQKKKADLFIGEVKKLKESFFKKAQDIQKYPVKDKAIEKIQSTKTFILTTPPKEHLRLIKEKIVPKFEKFKKALKSKNNIYTKVTLSSFLILGFSAYIVYFSGHRIYRSEYPSRTPASVQEYDYRPEYRLYEKKTLKILNVKVPVWSDEVGQVDTVTIDFSLLTSTRFARHYLLESEHRLRDYFFTSVEPVFSEFSLEEEGKEVLKEKIKEEINTFLIDNNVEGEILEVRILYIIGS